MSNQEKKKKKKCISSPKHYLALKNIWYLSIPDSNTNHVLDRNNF